MHSFVKVSRSRCWTWRSICGGAPSCIKSGLNTVFVTCRRHSTLDRPPWCNPFKVKWVENKGAYESTPHGPYTECNDHWCTTGGLVESHIRQFCIFTAPSSVKCASSVQKYSLAMCHPLPLVPETERQNEDVAADQGIFQLLHNLNLVGVPVYKCWPWDTQFTWHRSCTGCRIWGTFCTVSYSHSSFVDNFHRDGMPSSPRCYTKITSVLGFHHLL